MLEPVAKHRRAKHRRARRRASPTRLDSMAQKFLEGMGEPEPHPFRPSPFQEQALAAVMKRDVIVVAPTGSGKTWIAEQAIMRWLGQGAPPRPPCP
ncbi:MAG TPA: DEAD/DEAH box helicase [Armatimonadetes bacterium]|nr:DEAD/DEAH box helicase [Armatimonadota bacterium]